MSAPIVISASTARRYALGKQGLYPRRHWHSEAGILAAIEAMEVVQIDPISAVARNHDIALWSRVENYAPEMLERLCYEERRFFDYGSLLMLYPMHDLPHIEQVMQAWRSRLAHRFESHPELHDFALSEVRQRHGMTAREFEGRERVRGGYSTVKDTSAALHRLWLSGDLVTASRRRNERVYAPFESVMGRSHQPKAGPPEATIRHFALKALRDQPLSTLSEWRRRAANMAPHWFGTDGKAWLLQAIRQGDALPIVIEGTSETRYLPKEDVGLLREIEKGALPAQWLPLKDAQEASVNLLAPLDNALWDRGRFRALFGFEYLWEVYKPAEQRRWGYYTLPILYQDCAVGRIALRANRKEGILLIEGFWLEDNATAEDPLFLEAFALRLGSFAVFCQTPQLDPTVIPYPKVRRCLEQSGTKR